MKNSTIALLLTTGALLAFGFLSTAKKLQKISIYFNKIGKLSFKNAKLFLFIGLKAENPNKSPVVLNEIDLAVFYNNSQISTIKKTNMNLTIPAQGVVTIDNLETVVDVFTIVNTLLGSSSHQFAIRGTIKAGGFILPVDELITAQQ